VGDERNAPHFLQQERWETLRREQQAAPRAVTWRWQDRWHQAPPRNRDSRHGVAVSGLWQNCDAAVVVLTCSCGREAIVAVPPAYGEGGSIALADLNEIARAHQESAAQPAGRGCAR